MILWGGLENGLMKKWVIGWWVGGFRSEGGLWGLFLVSFGGWWFRRQWFG